MKYLDIVELIVDKDEYKEKGVQKGMRGRITYDEEREKFITVYFVLNIEGSCVCGSALDIPERELKVVDELTFLNGEKIVLPFNEYARVVVTEEKGKYTDDGVHKGFDGWICDPRRIENSWLVSFDQYGDLPDIACISVKERDMEVVVPAPCDLIDYEEWSKNGK